MSCRSFWVCCVHCSSRSWSRSTWAPRWVRTVRLLRQTARTHQPHQALRKASSCDRSATLLASTTLPLSSSAFTRYDIYMNIFRLMFVCVPTFSCPGGLSRLRRTCFEIKRVRRCPLQTAAICHHCVVRVQYRTDVIIKHHLWFQQKRQRSPIHDMSCVVQSWVVCCNRTSALVAPCVQCLRDEGLVWLIGTVVCSLAAAAGPIVRYCVQWMAELALQHHWLLPINYHFWWL